VKVNGDIVTKTDFEQRQIAMLRQRPELANVTPDSPELKKAIAEITPELILNAVDELLLVQRGRELGYTLGDEQFTSIIESIKKENKIESEEQFQAALEQEGLTLAELRRSLERQMIVSRVQQNEVMGKIAVTEDEATKYYAAHKGSSPRRRR
ncbi:MAG: SurA N-terminal domain-containing protein, partial [Burkholderiales bacterium]